MDGRISCWFIPACILLRIFFLNHQSTQESNSSSLLLYSITKMLGSSRGRKHFPNVFWLIDALVNLVLYTQSAAALPQFPQHTHTLLYLTNRRVVAHVARDLFKWKSVWRGSKERERKKMDGSEEEWLCRKDKCRFFTLSIFFLFLFYSKLGCVCIYL
jgi:hypothetical protein